MFLFLMLMKGTKMRGGFRIFLRGSRGGKTLLNLARAIKNRECVLEIECGGV